MRLSEIDEHLLQTLYREYSRDSTVAAYGIAPWVLVNRSGMYLGDAHQQLEAVRRMYRYGWIQVCGRPQAKTVRVVDRVKLAADGIRHAEDSRHSSIGRYAQRLWTLTVEGIVRAVRNG